uniref:Aquaporin NIP-type n=1 Tax=Kalanchoe fedtschenkoi TaxID=63787 RepID=A0A7N1A155_KALFE
MADDEITKLEEGQPGRKSTDTSTSTAFCTSPEVVTLLQKVAAELLGTFFIIFAGCGAVAVNNHYGQVTFPGVCVTWGLIVMAMIYALGHISGAHFNPAVTITFALFRHFPYKHVPLYIVAQVVGSIMASGVLCLLLEIRPADSFVSARSGSPVQALVMEIVVTFLFMFVISGVCTDHRAVGELAGFVIGMTLLLNVFVAGPVSGASMNPARSLGPAIVLNDYEGLWIYIVGPIVGAILGGGAYNLIRFTDKPLSELTKSSSFLKAGSSSRKASAG